MFQTSDVDLAAFLRIKGHRYEHITVNKLDPSLADFVFKQSPELDDLVSEWNSEQSPRHVDAKEFGRIRRQLFRNARRFLAGV